MTKFWNAELWLAMRPDAAMAADLSRDGRFSLHSGPTDQEAPSDSKLHGWAIAVTDPAALDRFLAALPHGPPSSGVAVFGVDLVDGSLVTLSADRSHRIIDSW